MCRVRRGDERVDVRLRNALRTLFEPGKILYISLRAADGREIQPPHAEAAFRRIAQKFAQHLCVNGRVAHYALFSDILLSGLKLRLDQAQHLSVRLEKPLNRRKYDFQ